MCMGVFCTCMSVHWVYDWYPQRPKEGTGLFVYCRYVLASNLQLFLFWKCFNYKNMSIIQKSPERKNPRAHHPVSFCRCSHLTHLFHIIFSLLLYTGFTMKVIWPSPRHLDNGEITQNSPQPLFTFWWIFFFSSSKCDSHNSVSMHIYNLELLSQ